MTLDSEADMKLRSLILSIFSEYKVTFMPPRYEDIFIVNLNILFCFLHFYIKLHAIQCELIFAKLNSIDL